ncbi:MAG: alpha-amylase [Marinilabiliales bacterium]|nr:MAG: alpha-amylase [Marinilabiliales bacterium]
MKSICFYFQVHQPYRLRNYRFFEIGKDHYYFDDYQNRYIMQRVAQKCYLPMNNLLLDLINEYGQRFKISFSISGVALEQFRDYAPEVLDSFRRLAETGSVEFLAETYSHSLAALRSKEEFAEQIAKQQQLLKELVGYESKTFRNTELIYSDEIGAMVYDLGFETMLTEGAKHILGWRSPNYMYTNAINPKMKLLLKNFRLSDDIAFRFSQQSWDGFPLTAEKYVDWLNSADYREEVIHLFMDYETFGEHQWQETGIFEFMRALPQRVFSNSQFTFNTPSDLSEQLQPVSAIHVPHPISWADEERDLTAWLGNDLQDDAFDALYELEGAVKQINDYYITEDWLKLQTSDHFYYMCTKWFSDGDVHKYFNPYGTPYDAYINFMNVLSDFRLRVKDALPSNGKLEAEISEMQQERELSSVQTIKEPVVAKKPSHKKKSTKKTQKPINKPNVLTVRKVLTILTSEEIWTLYAGVNKTERQKIEKYIGKKKWKEMIVLKESGVKPTADEKQAIKKKYKELLMQHA